MSHHSVFGSGAVWLKAHSLHNKLSKVEPFYSKCIPSRNRNSDKRCCYIVACGHAK